MYAREISSQGERILTDQQRRFVQEFTDGASAGNAGKAAAAAGYSAKTAASIGCSLLKVPHVGLAIDAALREALGGPLSVEAVALLRRVIRDEDAPLKLRADVATRIVEYSGIVDRVKVEKARQTGLDASSGAPGRRLGELTRAELEDVVRQGAGILAAAAALPPAGPVIEGVKREGFTKTHSSVDALSNDTNALA